MVHPVPPGDGQCDAVLQLFGRQHCLLLPQDHEVLCIKNHTGISKNIVFVIHLDSTGRYVSYFYMTMTPGAALFCVKAHG